MTSQCFIADEALNEPEDLLLEELMRGWKWAREHQSQDPLNRIQHQQLQAVQNRPFHSPLDLFHHKFGYRPHEAGFHQSTIPRHQFNPIHGINSLVRLPKHAKSTETRPCLQMQSHRAPLDLK